MSFWSWVSSSENVRSWFAALEMASTAASAASEALGSGVDATCGEADIDWDLLFREGSARLWVAWAKPVGRLLWRPLPRQRRVADADAPRSRGGPGRARPTRLFIAPERPFLFLTREGLFLRSKVRYGCPHSKVSQCCLCRK